MWWKWFPWKQVVSRVARSRGLVDPVRLLSRLESFAQPLEVKEPLELLRAGMVFHARGLLNTGAIQHNLDWIWPFWVERQYDPADDAFLPRAFSITHVNLTHRNWTAVGLPGFDEYPIVDPRGLLTPFWDGWSLDCWLEEDGRSLHPSQMDAVTQRLDLEEGWAVETRCVLPGMELHLRAEVRMEAGAPSCLLGAAGRSERGGGLVVALRPFNPEGVSFVPEVRLDPHAPGWVVGKRGRVRFSEPPDSWHFSDYRRGDVHGRLSVPAEDSEIRCKVGMASAAALFRLEPGRGREVRASVPLPPEKGRGRHTSRLPQSWGEALAPAIPCHLPERRFQELYRAALGTLVLHSPGEVFPGPYTYRRFWFRDASFILHALLSAGFEARVEQVLDTFPGRQSRSGFFCSQEGEWDSNGQVLWLFHRFCRLTGKRPKPAWREAILKGGRWIARKRGPAGEGPHAGLLPPGFSAEHLGPNDYYYWDDFWGAAGLRAGGELLEEMGDEGAAREFHQEARSLLDAVERSLGLARKRLGRPAMPAAPDRRLDSGSVGSLAAGYPLQLFAPEDPRLADTADYLLERCLVQGGFYQDIIHSGINAYLTLHLAQVLLRAGRPRALELMRTVAGLASPTGQWPEAIHPRTLGGCMGDGHHVWAAAEWVLMVRNLFLREEGRTLVLAQGIPHWLEGSEPLLFGPAPTAFGPVRVEIRPSTEGIDVGWSGEWRGAAPAVEVHLPGREPVAAKEGSGRILLPPAEGAGPPFRGGSARRPS